MPGAALVVIRGGCETKYDAGFPLPCIGERSGVTKLYYRYGIVAHKSAATASLSLRSISTVGAVQYLRWRHHSITRGMLIMLKARCVQPGTAPASSEGTSG